MRHGGGLHTALDSSVFSITYPCLPTLPFLVPFVWAPISEMERPRRAPVPDACRARFELPLKKAATCKGTQSAARGPPRCPIQRVTGAVFAQAPAPARVGDQGPLDSASGPPAAFQALFQMALYNHMDTAMGCSQPWAKASFVAADPRALSRREWDARAAQPPAAFQSIARGRGDLRGCTEPLSPSVSAVQRDRGGAAACTWALHTCPPNPCTRRPHSCLPARPPRAMTPAACWWAGALPAG